MQRTPSQEAAMTATDRNETRRTDPTAIHTVRGGGRLRLHVREWGRPDGPPILFLHGWSQNHLCWTHQYGSTLADEFRLVACDLRGHGMSDAPLEPEHYTNGQRWADDVAAILDELHLDRPTLVGWSYGALVIGDFIRVHGQHRVGAINFVDGVVQLGPAAFGTLIGPGFLDHFADLTADDLPTNIRALQAFLHRIVATPLPADEFHAALCWNMAVPARVRANLAARDLDFDDVLQTLQVPLLVSHGRADVVVLPAMAEHIHRTAPTAEISWYDNVGHAPHLEQPARFNHELAALTRQVHA
jgi:pimeloyl-ACP methyl ester carboxylesterase